MTPKQERFVREYLVDLNATQAAIRAGYSERTATSQGARLLSKANVSAAVQRLQAKRLARVEVKAEHVVAELAKVAFASLADVTDWGTKEVAFGFDADGHQLRPEDIGDAVMVRYADAPFVTPINRDDLPEAIRAAVSEVALTKDGFRIKMHDKVGALLQLGRHLGIFGGDQAPPVNINIALIDRPPTETRAEWLERKARERALIDASNDERAA